LVPKLKVNVGAVPVALTAGVVAVPNEKVNGAAGVVVDGAAKEGNVSAGVDVGAGFAEAGAAAVAAAVTAGAGGAAAAVAVAVAVAALTGEAPVAAAVPAFALSNAVLNAPAMSASLNFKPKVVCFSSSSEKSSALYTHMLSLSLRACWSQQTDREHWEITSRSMSAS
jgi:hypothetical protein